MSAIVFVALLTATMGVSALAAAQNNDGAFSLQVTPSPIISTIKPGTRQKIEFQIRNQGNSTEQLKIELKKFNVDASNGGVQITDEAPTDIKEWISISEPTVTVKAGESLTEYLDVNAPNDIGFSYSFTVVISRNQEPTSDTGKTKIKGSVAIFALLAVDRPGAERKFDITEFSASRRVYEYLPATFNVSLKNTGNTLVQPYGNIYIQRSPNSTEPISVMKLNEAGAYLLPGVTRSLPVKWTDGFPVYQQVKGPDNAQETTKLTWDWSNIQNFRFGKYYAKIIAVYNDGQRDIPIESTVSFWVIPWKLIIALTLILGVLCVGIVTIIKKPIKSHKNKSSKKHDTEENSPKNT